MTKPASRRSRRPYHHGDLKAALLTVAEQILEQHGVQELTLRAIARAAGVSHAAPNNHFGDLTGLLSELAALGFRRFGAALDAATKAAGDDPASRLKSMGTAYVGFARQHPGLFSLMFRSERLDSARPALRDAIDEARRALRDGIIGRAGGQALTPAQLAGRAAALWSLVHGFAVLLLDNRLDGLMRIFPGDHDADGLLDAVLTTTRVGD
jgi:AcrR family transcriptional regulator